METPSNAPHLYVRKIGPIILIMSLLTSGCAGQRIPAYDYHKPSYFTDIGRFNLTFNPDLRQRVTDEGIVWEVAGPYRFNTQYLQLDKGALRGQICNIQIESAVSEFHFAAEGCKRDALSDRSGATAAPRSLIGFGVGDIEMPYEDMLVSFDFEIVGADGDVLDSGTVKQVVTRNPGTTVLH